VAKNRTDCILGRPCNLMELAYADSMAALSKILLNCLYTIEIYIKANYQTLRPGNIVNY